jgi:hypothetical protein
METIEKTTGLLLRLRDGTLYYIPKEWLATYQLPAEYQPGGTENIDLTIELDKTPPLLNVRNAVYLEDVGLKISLGNPPRQLLPHDPNKAGRQVTPNKWSPFENATISQTTTAETLRAAVGPLPKGPG